MLGRGEREPAGLLLARVDAERRVLRRHHGGIRAHPQDPAVEPEHEVGDRARVGAVEEQHEHGDEDEDRDQAEARRPGIVRRESGGGAEEEPGDDVLRNPQQPPAQQPIRSANQGGYAISSRAG